MHVQTHTPQTHTACLPPKHSQHVNPAWKLEKQGFNSLQLDVFHGNRILTASQLDETCVAH